MPMNSTNPLTSSYNLIFYVSQDILRSHTTLTNHNLDNSMFHLKAKPYN